MQAYRKLIRTHHPDKGGSAAEFRAIQDAFDVVSDASKRAVYDAWAKELQFRYVQGVAAKASQLHLSCCSTTAATVAGRLVVHKELQASVLDPQVLGKKLQLVVTYKLLLLEICTSGCSLQ